MRETTETGTWTELVRGETGMATAMISLGVVLFAFNTFVVATALPPAVREFGGDALISWATSLYLILSILTGASAAAVMHRLGVRRLFLASAVVFVAGTVMAAGASNMEVLLAGRALQGAAGGVIEAGCYVLIPRLFPHRLIPKVFGVEAVAWAVAAFGAPALSGWLTTAVSWRVALLSATPLALVFLALVPRVTPAGRGTGPAPGLPVLPLGGIAAGMALVVVSDSVGPLTLRLGLVAVGFALFIAVVRGDGRAKVRLLPRQAFRLGHASGIGMWIAFLMPVAEAAQTVFVNYTLQFLWGFTPLLSGLSTAVLALSWSGMQTLASHKNWPRIALVVAGGVLIVTGQATMTLALMSGSRLLMLAALMLLGAAFGASWGAMSQLVMENAPAEERDVTSGLLPVVMSAGYGIGAAIWGLVANGLGFAGASGPALQRVMVEVFALAGLPALAALGMAFLMARSLRVSSAGSWQ